MARSKKQLKSDIVGTTDAIIYVRVSTTKQDPLSQIIRCKEYCERMGFQVVMIFQDKYTGGGDFMKRPAMRELLEYVEKSENGSYAVVFDDLKRFARDVQFHLKLRSTFQQYSLTPHCLNFNFDDSPEGRFVEVIMAGQAELEREQNARQVRQKQRARLVAGYNAFIAPFGYIKNKKHPIHQSLDVPNKHAKSVTEALEKFASGTLFYKSDVIRFLQKRGVLGEKIVVKYYKPIDRFLTNIFYAGYIEYKPWGVTRRKGHHEPLINLATYHKIQYRLEQHKSRSTPRKDRKEDFPLRGLIDCALCGAKLTAGMSKGRSKTYAYYHCWVDGCLAKGKSIPSTDLHDAFRKLVKRRLPSKPLVDLITATYIKVWEEESLAIHSDSSNLSLRVDTIEQEISKLVNKRAS